MLRQQAKLVALSVYIVDLILIIISFALAYWARDSYLFVQYGRQYPLRNYLGAFLFIVPLWSFLLYYFGLFESYRTAPLWAEPWAFLKVTIWGIVMVGTGMFVFNLHPISRLFLVIFGGTSFILLSVERSLIRTVARKIRRSGLNYKNIVIVGTGRRARDIAKIIEDQQQWGLQLLGMITDNSKGHLPKVGDYPVVGHIDQISTILQTQVIDEVIFAVSRKKLEELEGIFLKCEELGIRTRVAVNFFPHMIAKVHLDDLHGIPLLTFTTTPYNELQLVMKRGFDLVVSMILLLLFAPAMILMALLIKITSPGPILFKQTRVGLNGRQFTLYKFRTMVHDAEARKGELLHLNEMEGPVFKIKDDPRLTQFGKFLRRTSLDELPQLLKVLKGTMSIVGPRPPLPEEVSQYRTWQRRRLSMKPGITCLWQINGRSYIKNFDQWMKLDLEYIDNWSLKLDWKIFIKTIPVVLLGRGAS